jgi:hypothetical protein
VGPAASFVILPATDETDPSGQALALGAGGRLKLHHDSTTFFGISPWIDANAFYVRTGQIDRPGFDVGAGVSIPVEPMNEATISETSFLLSQGIRPVLGAVSYDALTDTATFAPALPLEAGHLYAARITTVVADADGVTMVAEEGWSFTTDGPPSVVAELPLDGDQASINARPSVEFSKVMDPLSINDLTFTLSDGVDPVSGRIELDELGTTAIFIPDADLEFGIEYTAVITTGATDLRGEALVELFEWSFTTAACGQAPVDLGAAATFAVLAGSTVTSTGQTRVTGDLGVSPGTAVSGFLPGTVTDGAIEAGTPAAAQGIADLTTAYNDAAGRTLCPVSVAGNLGGQTLAPGLYKSTSSLAVSSGELTVDAQGDGDAVFIFQMASTLTTTSGRQVILVNGAQATNVFWQVGTSATLGSTTVFAGTIMADQAITLETGATLDGRALARIAAVALDSNIVTLPTP